MSLYHLAAEYHRLEQLETDDADDTLLEAIHNTLEGLQDDIQVKATNVGAHILNLEAYATAAADTAKALSARAKRIQRRADVMREYVRTHLAEVGIKKIESPEFTLTRKANPPAVVIEAGAEVPKDYLQPLDPIIPCIVQGVADLQSDVVTLLESTPPVLIAEEYFVVSREALIQVIERQLPPRQPDKKRISEVLKAAYKAHDELLKKAVANNQPVPTFLNPIPGCRLEQGERLVIAP